MILPNFKPINCQSFTILLFTGPENAGKETGGPGGCPPRDSSPPEFT